MPIDWTGRLQTNHDKPRTAILLDGLSPGGKRRVAIIGDHALTHEMGRSAYTIEGAFDTKDWPTVYLFDENGRCNCDGNPSPFDLINVADTLAKAA